MNMPYERPSSVAVNRIDPDVAHELVESGRAVLVDVRERGAYAHRHIAGALSIPVAQLMANLGFLPRDKAVIFYCT
jgi:rhodanese-related sulfurtransferase